MDNKELNGLEAEHQPDAIIQRISKKSHPSYLRDAVLGAIDGAVTTFAVVAGAAGGGFSAQVALTLGLANLVADAFSMAVSNYQGARSRREELEKAKRSESRQIAVYPEGEREEIRQIFRQKGFEGDILKQIVETITQNKQQWIDTMITDELGLETEIINPWKAAAWTMGAFIIIGVLPLTPFFITDISMADGFGTSAVITAAAFFIVGAVKGYIVKNHVILSGIQTLLLGSFAAVLAFLVAYFLQA